MGAATKSTTFPARVRMGSVAQIRQEAQKNMESSRLSADIRIRPISSDDWIRLRRFHRRLSPTTVALRFHAAKGELTVPLAQRLTQLDGHDEVAFVATKGAHGRIVGVARYSRIGGAAAEVAFVVEDSYQGHHIGSRLMIRLREAALENGIVRFIAEVLPGNAPMFRLLDEAGRTTTRFEGGECEVVVDLLQS